MNSRNIEDQVLLEILAQGRLPPKVIRAIKQTVMTAKEVGQWEISKPPWSVSLKKWMLSVEIHGHISLKKVLVIATAVVPPIVALVRYLVVHWDEVQVIAGTVLQAS